MVEDHAPGARGALVDCCDEVGHASMMAAIDGIGRRSVEGCVVVPGRR
jgi:hypothetical protein